MAGFSLGLSRLVLTRSTAGASRASVDTTGKVYTTTPDTKLKPGSTAILYGNGTQIASVTVDGTGKATWTLGTAPAGGTIITYDGVVVGSGGTAPTPPPAALAISGANGTANVGDTASFTPTISSGTAPYTVTATGLPPGRAIQTPSTGLTTGAYTTAGSYSTTYTVTDSSTPQQTASFTRSVVVSAAAASAILPTVSAAPRILYATKKTASGATTAATVRRQSDSVMQAIGFDANGDLDLAAARTFAGTSTLTHGVLALVTPADQSGNGLASTATTGAVSPWLISERDAYGPNFADRAAFSFGSQKYAFTGVSAAQVSLTFPSGLTRGSQNYAMFYVAAPLVSYQNNALVLLGTVTGATRNNVFTDKSGGLEIGSVNSGTFSGKIQPIALLPRTNPQVISVVSRSDAKTAWMEDLSAALSAEDVQTLTGGGFGLTGAGAAYYTNQDFYAYAEYPSTITDAEAASIRSTLSAAYATGKRANRIVVADSSTPEGVGSINNRNYSHLMRGQLSKDVDLYNVAISGNTITNARDQAAAKVDPLYSTSARSFYLIDSGSNDILSYTSGTAANDAASIYAILKTLVQARISVGWRVLVATITPRSDYTAYQEQVRVALNTQMRNGQADLGYVALFDRAGITQAQTPTDTTYYQQETGGAFIHPKDPLEVIYGQALASVIQGLLQ